MMGGPISQKRVRDAMNRLALNGQQEGTSTVYLDNKVGESGERVVVLRADDVLEIAFLLTLVPVTDNTR